jgi:hypothetical protein
MNPLFRAVSGAAIAVGLAIACSSGQAGPDSETHWLRTCASDTECSGSSCVCGLCTRPCETAKECGSLSAGAACVSPNSSCSTTTVCDALCSTASDCAALGEGHTCVDGRCRPSATAVHVSGEAWTWDSVATCRVNGDTSTVTVLHATYPVAPLVADAQAVYVTLDATGDAPGSNPAFEIVAIPLPCGKPSTLARRSGYPFASPVLANGALYWIDDGGIVALPASGGRVRSLASPPPAGRRPVIAARNEFVYWGDATGTVARVPAGGGTPEILASGYGEASAIALDDDNVYWAWGTGLSDGGPVQGALLKVPVGGGAVTTITGDVPTSILPTATELYWANPGGFGIDAPLGDGSIMHLSASGGPPGVLVAGGSPAFLQTRGDTLYWLNLCCHAQNTIRSVVPPESSATELVSSVAPDQGVGSFVVSPDRLIWLEEGDNPKQITVYSKPLPP